MPTIQIAVQRHSVVSSRPFESVVARLTVSIGHPDMVAFPRDMAAARNLRNWSGSFIGPWGRPG
jgi:hypothetical protein